MDFQINPKIIASGRGPDLCAAAGIVHRGEATATALLVQSLTAADTPAAEHAFVRRFDAQARAAAMAVDHAHDAGAPVPALAGLAVSIKDLFDVGGQPTTAGSASMADAEPAAADCPAVARMRAAGAALIGHTNLSEFAFSGVGINPHHGTPANPVTQVLNATPRIPGGSSSGAAVSVASGAAWAALGSDTGGSIRIPAALQGLVGFKSTQRRVPLDGAIPLSTTLDTACAITRSVRDAALVHGILAARTPHPLARPLGALRLAVVQTVMLDGLDTEVGRSFEQALALLRAAGAQLEELPLAQLNELANLQAQGGFAAAESWAWHRQRLDSREHLYDPRVALRIRRGQAMGAADYIDLIDARRHWIAAVESRLASFDAVLSPTVPMVAPPLAPLLGNDQRFFAINTLLLRNPSVVNMLDGCALSLPCQAPGQMPVGLMVWGPALADDTVLGVSQVIETTLAAAFHGSH
ncbi:amidase [Aquabacterium sp. OR-4]|uniref:amidase n=1 Tax=Aquabacterium sp. OR-4 TaxID=2978127 RepID=UPI0028C708BD|nr:amidase [Aquabacterium sp. OR-4]MDT7835463.1 amidase [Aquabacterium sp. OR-4]